MIRDHSALQGRLRFLWTLIWLSGVVLGLRLFQLQILQSSRYKLAAERNRSQIIPQAAPRGRIYDRNGVLLATSVPAFTLIYIPGKRRDNVDLRPLARELARELKQDPRGLYAKLQQAVRQETAVRLAENLPRATMFRLSELKSIYPGIDLIVEARRYYPFGRFASHLIGYLGRIDPRSWERLRGKGYRPDSRIGRLGLEGVFENELRGRDGGIRLEVDARGRIKRILERIDWRAGDDLHLTIDASIQKVADEALRNSKTGRGAVVAIDPRTGDILALSSQPDFDPNALLSPDPRVVIKQVRDLPEFDYAISGNYPPGSTFKPIVAAAGLNEGLIDPDESVYCPGYFDLGHRRFLCWQHSGHHEISFLMGLAQSCDVYFYKMGLKMGAGVIERYEREFHLGRKTGVILAGESGGRLSGPAARAESGRAWYDGDTLNLAIGQGSLLVTPLQMALVAATLANHGVIWRPHCIKRIVYADGRPDYV
ncbi:MAG: hypothetical protein KGK30_03260, partial [Elusimicrobia bacterium]|nr:hypothetical protein [Elusimicrobiota bacterium]